MIASAISTTATKYDKNGELIMAEGSDVGSQYPSTPFDFGAGFVCPSRAMDPGLVLSSGENTLRFPTFLGCSICSKSNNL